MQFETILLADSLSGFTILMGFFFVLSANFLIGLIEGTILFLFFRGRPTMPETPAWNGLHRWALFGFWLKAVFLMFIANLVSAFVGFLIIPGWYLDNLPLEWLLGSSQNASSFYNIFWGIIGFSAIITLVIEWPFVYFCVARGRNRFGRSLLGDLVVHIVSYPLLIGTLIFFNIFLFGTVINDVFHIVPADQISVAPGGRVYYIGINDHRIHRLNLDDRSDIIISEKITGIIHPYTDRLIWKENEVGDQWSLYICNKENEPQLIIESVAPFSRFDIAANYDPDCGFTNWDHRYSEYLTSQDFRAKQNRNIIFRMPNYPIIFGHSPNNQPLDGYFLVYGNYDNTDYSFVESGRLYFMNPFHSLPLFAPNILPDNRVILQIGQEICLFDYKTRRLAILARGFGPVVAIERGKSESVPAQAAQTQ
jgi:hypothetical protein